jgi:hypothetical protein
LLINSSRVKPGAAPFQSEHLLICTAQFRPANCTVVIEDVTMHIQRSQMNLNAVNPYSAAAEKALSAQRAAAVRKKLLKSARGIEGASSPEEAFMVGRWMDSRYSQGQNEEP